MRSKTLRIIVFLLIFCLKSAYSLASEKGTIRGMLIDSETLTAVPFATVELLGSIDSNLVKATISDTTGRFGFDNIGNGTYLLRISVMGYKKKIVSNVEISENTPTNYINEIKLSPEIKQLDEAVVVGAKLSGVVKEDKTIYYINDKSAEIAQSGLELLKQLPDVSVSAFTDEVRMAGRNNILFQVNGRKVEPNYLMQLNPGLIDKIEVINNPGASYDLEVDAVINIVLKRQLQRGMSGSARVSSSTSANTLISKNNANIDYYLSHARFYVGGYYKPHNYTTQILNERTIFSPNASKLYQKTLADDKGTTGGTNYGVDWFVNDKNSLSVFASYQPIDRDNITSNTINEFMGDEIEQSNYSSGDALNKNYFYNYSIYYSHAFSKESHAISIETYGSNVISESSNKYHEYEDKSDVVFTKIQNQLVESNNKYSYIKVNYNYPISDKLKFSAGYSNYFLSRDYEYNNLITDFSDNTDYQESRHAAYFNLSSNINKLNVQSGLRFENSNTDITHITDTDNRYNFWSPSLSVNYKNKSGVYRFSYRRSIGRPGINQLSPAVYVKDSYARSQGNPALNPSFADRFDFEHRIQFKNSMYINYKPYLSFMKEGIKQVKFLRSDSLEINQFNNVSNELEYGINVSGLISVKKVWTLTPSFTYYYRNIKALPEYGIANDLIDNSWRMNLSSHLILPKNWVVFAEFNYEAPVIDHQNKKYGHYDFVIGTLKPINKKLSVSVFALNPWANQYVYDKRTYQTETMKQTITNSIKYDYLLVVRLSYKFKKGKTGRSINKSTEPEEINQQSKGMFD